MVVQAEVVVGDDPPPGSPMDEPTTGSGNTSPAVLLLDDYSHPPSQQPASASQIDSPFRIQGALEAGQPVDHWDYYSTTDNLEECGVDDELGYVPGRGFRRYYPALRQLAPFRFATMERKVLPVDSVGLLSFATFSWMTGFMWKLYRRGSFAFDSYRCSFMESCNINSQRFEYLWGEELRSRGSEASVFRTAWRFMRTRVALATVIYTVNLLSGLLTPLFFLPVLVDNASRSEPSYLEGSFYALAILLVDSTRGLLMSLHGAITARTALRLRSAILTLVYRKVISLNSLGRTNSGQILNLFSNDSQRLLDFGQVMHMWIAGLLTVLVSFVWLVSVLRVPGATGVGAFFVFFFLQYWFAKMTATYKARAVGVTDGRVQKIREVLSAIKVIKVNAWENAFFKIISNLRFNELRLIQKIVFLQFMTGAFSNCLPAVATIVTFMTCVALGQSLGAAQIFAALGVLGWSRYGLVFLPVSLGAIAQVRVTMTRVKELLLLEDNRPCVSLPRDPNHAVCLTNATFGCDANAQDEEDGKKNNGKSTATNSSGKKKKGAGLQTRKILQSSESNANETGETEFLAADGNAETPPKIIDVLFAVNLSVPKGQLVGICGPVGSGKSSLLLAILGQLHLRRGDLAFRGSFAYLSQQSWLMNATLRQNIVFADTFDSKRYYSAIHCCNLNEDLEALAGGDQTEIGESGSTLSGGQKQRVVLARAVYANRDICLLDDPFSALDGHVSEHVFENCIRGALKTKTVLLVTQAPKYLAHCDHVVAVQNGAIVEQGSPKELMAKNGYYASLIRKAEPDARFEDSSDGREFKKNGSKDSVSLRNGAKSYYVKSVAGAVAGRLTRAEERGSGRISWQTYAAYVSAMGGVGVAFTVMLSVIVFAAVIIMSGWWISAVIRGQAMAPAYVPVVSVTTLSTTTLSTTPLPPFLFPDNETSSVASLVEGELLPSPEPFIDSMGTTSTMDDTTIIVVFGAIFMAIVIMSVVQAFLFSKATMAASRRLHDSMLDKVFHGTLRFFEITPIGRILNVFSKDLDEVDCILPTMLNICSVMLWSCVFSLLSVAIIFPYFLLSVPILGVVFAYTVALFTVTAREVKRRENASRSPLFGHVNVTLQGLASLHAYDKERLFEREFVRLHDDNSALTFLLIGSIRWMGVRLDLLVAICSSLVAVFIVFLHGTVSPSFAAMALIYCSTLSGLFQYTVRIISETQARFTNVERIIRYEQTLEWEGAKRNSLPPAPHDWPSKGEVTFQNVDLKYREGLPLSLSGVSFRVPAAKKVSIVGRTGAGKSSLGVALFRLVETQCGTVAIDDMDIARLPLSDLRSRMSIIPQDPVLFKGTVRYNLDPLNEHTDENIWHALAKIHLHEKVAGMENQLSCSVAEGGDNFSVGEKQLLCLARALLRRSKIIFLDEALASVDSSTHALLHDAIFESCDGCTVLSVAHRLDHVMSYDYVLVMNDAKVVEFGTPDELASNASSWFSSLVAAEQERGDAGLPYST